LTDAVSAPERLGLKVIEIVQLAPDAIVVPQLFEMVKSDALVPVIVIPETARKEVPVLVTVAVLTALVATVWLPKLTLVGAKLTAGDDVDPPPNDAQLFAAVHPYKLEPAAAAVLKNI
jgi:hypothetical protein